MLASDHAGSARPPSRSFKHAFPGLFPSLLSISVYGFALSLLLGRGTYEIALYLGAFAVAGTLATAPASMRPGRPLLVLLGFGLVFLVQGMAAADGPIAGKFHLVLAWSMLMATAVTLLPDRIGGPAGLTHRQVSAALPVLFVLVQIPAYRGNINKAGLFSNIHYLALYAAVTLPALYYFAMTAATRVRWIFLLALAGDFWLLMKTQSRPGFLALLAGAMATIPFLSRRTRLVATGAILFVPATLYFTGWFGFADRIDDLVANFVNEERPVIWRETLAMLSANSIGEWWFGHGLGQFFRDYQPTSSFHYKEDYASPHNYFLDLLYSHGVVGLALFLAAFVLYYRNLAAATRASRDGKRAGILLIAVTTVALVHGFLTLPFFSRHNLHPLSLILGAGLVYLGKKSRHE